jgi:hypothetical protein
MGAGLQRDIKRCRSSGVAGPRESLGLGMRSPASLSPSPADNHAVPHDYRADRRIWPAASQPAPSERHGKLHEARVVLLGFSHPAYLRFLFRGHVCEGKDALHRAFNRSGLLKYIVLGPSGWPHSRGFPTMIKAGYPRVVAYDWVGILLQADTKLIERIRIKRKGPNRGRRFPPLTAWRTAGDGYSKPQSEGSPARFF